MELTSDVTDFKGTQDVDPKTNLPTIIQEAYFMAKDPAKEFITIDQTRKMWYFSTLKRKIF